MAWELQTKVALQKMQRFVLKELFLPKLLEPRVYTAYCNR
jgi:hypothetical protein